MRAIDRRSLLAGPLALAVAAPAVAAESMTPEQWGRSAITSARFLFKGVRPMRFNMMTSTMAPTIALGDIVLADFRTYPTSALRGEMVVVHRGGVDFIKRVVGLPGDRIALRGTRPIVNGSEANWLPEGTIRVTLHGQEFVLRVVEERIGAARPHRIALETTDVPDHASDEFIVPEAQVWVLGDTRDSTIDSRASDWGPRPVTEIVGRIFYRIHPSPGFLVPPETVPGLEGE